MGELHPECPVDVLIPLSPLTKDVLVFFDTQHSAPVVPLLLDGYGTLHLTN